MADKPSNKDLLPALLPQNPSGVGVPSQAQFDKVQEQVDRILAVFRQLVPSNYISTIQGPHYMLRFQTAAEAIATIQCEAQEAFADGFWEYTRPEFLFQILGLMVFPDARADGIPVIDGDLSYRDFLREMVKLLLAGATKATVQSGLELLSDAVFEIIERGIEARKLGPLAGWGLDDKFTFEINVSVVADSVPAGDLGVTEPDPVILNGFPDDPFVLQENVRLVLKALKPAHTLFDYRHLFKDFFGDLFTDAPTFDLQTYYYDDLRKFCFGCKEVIGTTGETLADRSLFSDPTRDFTSISPGAPLTVLTGPNSTTASAFDEGFIGRYRIIEILTFPGGDDTGGSDYTTSPTSLTGTATVSGDDIEDLSQNWALAVEGEILTFTEGPNAGSYRLKTLLGSEGGPLGKAPGPATRVRIAPSHVRIRGFMSVAATGQAYTISVDRLGVQVPNIVTDEDVSSFFIPGDATEDTFLVKKGPLVKGWGDGTPATKQDVTVTVDATPVTVDSVNPYWGQIVLETPVATSDPPPTVLVSYIWKASPVFAMAGLNTLGLTLNKWDLNGKIPDSPRFPFGVVLGPPSVSSRRRPVYVSHRYLGYEQAYTATLNNPNTLLLNQNPKSPAVPGFRRVSKSVAVAYEGVTAPTASAPVWVLDGTDEGGVNIGGVLAGTYTVVDNDLDPGFDPDERPIAVYRRGLDLSFPAAVTLVGRFFADRGDASDYDGVFTGVGFGVHNNARLYVVGALLVNGLEHVGLLLNAARPFEVGSWSIGPNSDVRVLTSTTVEMVTADIPADLAVGEAFQILSGTQAGTYTIASLVQQSDGTTTVTVVEEFPADPTLFGNRDFTVLFESLWSTGPSTYRLDVDPDTGTAVVTVSGETVGTVASIVNNPPLFPQPADTSLVLSPSVSGQVFWGSLSRRAISRSTWSFFRYAMTPDQTVLRDRRISVAAEMTIVPEDEPVSWFTTQTFGFSEIDVSATKLLLKSTSSDDTLDFTFGYSRLEPFLTPTSTFDLRSIFRVESGTLGAGDGQIIIADTEREVRLGTLLYREGLADPYRQLIELPHVSFNGVRFPGAQGWADESTGDDFEVVVQGRTLLSTQPVGTKVQFRQTLDLSGLGWADTGSRIFEGRLTVVSHTAVGDRTGIFIGGEAGATNNFIGVRLRAGSPTGIRMVDGAGTPIQEYDFPWDDGEPHTYRVIVDVVADTVVVLADDVVLTPTLTFAAFAVTSTDVDMFFGQLGSSLDAGLASTVEWYSTSYIVQPPADAKRTLGVWLGDDVDDIDNWELPRTDSTTTLNSDEIGPVIEEMDWTVDTEVRLLRDPTWGVTVYRPDLALPPFYLADDITPPLDPGGGFAVDTTEPSAGWINVEYRNLPTLDSEFGFTSFGALDSRSVTQQRWDRVAYLLYKHPTEDFKAPQNHVLNRFNTIHSGELSKDVTPEEVVVPTISTTEVTLLPTHLFADRIFKVVEEGVDPFTTEMLVFDKETQHITLIPDADGNPRAFSATGIDVTVVFAPGKPVSTTYLLNQPFLDSCTLLNEGTPPVPKSQTNSFERYIVFGDDPADIRKMEDDVSGNVLSDPYRVSVFRPGTDSLYGRIEFFEATDGGEEGLIAIACENTLPVGDSGYDSGAGDPIYSDTGGGDPLGGTGESAGLFETGSFVGAPFGGMVLDYSGAFLSEVDVILTGGLGGTGHGMFIASGDGIFGSQLAPPGGTPLAVLAPAALQNTGFHVSLKLTDTTTGVVTSFEFVE